MTEIPFHYQDIPTKPAAVDRVLTRLAEADTLVPAGTEYNHSPALKNILDWASREPNHVLLAGKPVAIMEPASAWEHRVRNIICARSASFSISSPSRKCLPIRLPVASMPSKCRRWLPKLSLAVVPRPAETDRKAKEAPGRRAAAPVPPAVLTAGRAAQRSATRHLPFQAPGASGSYFEIVIAGPVFSTAVTLI